MDSTLARLQQWYAAQCDGDWEHGLGIRIDTLDNPGWRVTIDLAGTDLQGRTFTPIERGLEEDATTDWHCIRVAQNRFEGTGDPTKLAFILDHFMAWAKRPT